MQVVVGNKRYEVGLDIEELETLKKAQFIFEDIIHQLESQGVISAHMEQLYIGADACESWSELKDKKYL